MLPLVKRLEHLPNIQIHRTIEHTPAAADAKNRLRLFNRIGKFVHEALAHPLFFIDARIVPEGVFRKEGVLAGIPGTESDAFADGGRVQNRPRYPTVREPQQFLKNYTDV
jgi:hypothetical protein